MGSCLAIMEAGIWILVRRLLLPCWRFNGGVQRFSNLWRFMLTVGFGGGRMFLRLSVWGLRLWEWGGVCFLLPIMVRRALSIWLIVSVCLLLIRWVSLLTGCSHS